MSDLSSQIETNAAKPKRATIDGNSVEQHSLKEQIEADQYLADETAKATPRQGMVFSRFKPGGTVN